MAGTRLVIAGIPYAPQMGEGQGILPHLLIRLWSSEPKTVPHGVVLEVLRLLTALSARRLAGPTALCNGSSQGRVHKAITSLINYLGWFGLPPALGIQCFLSVLTKMSTTSTQWPIPTKTLAFLQTIKGCFTSEVSNNHI